MLKYEKIRLRAVEYEDLDFLYQLRQDEEIINNLFSPMPVSRSEQNDWFEKMKTDLTQKVLIVEDNLSHTIGCVRLTNIDHFNQKIEIGADIVQEYRGRGWGANLYKAVCNYCFCYFNMRRIYLYVFESNAKAINLYEKMGFVTEGVLKEAVFKHGKHQNVKLMALLRSNYHV